MLPITKILHEYKWDASLGFIEEKPTYRTIIFIAQITLIYLLITLQFFANRSYIQINIHNRLAISICCFLPLGAIWTWSIYFGANIFSHIVCLYDIYQYFQQHAVLFKPKKVIVETLYNLSFFLVFALRSCKLSIKSYELYFFCILFFALSPGDPFKTFFVFLFVIWMCMSIVDWNKSVPHFFLPLQIKLGGPSQWTALCVMQCLHCWRFEVKSKIDCQDCQVENKHSFLNEKLVKEWNCSARVVPWLQKMHIVT